MKPTPIEAALFVQNRKKLMEILPEDSMVMVGSAMKVLRNGDQFYPYRQRSDFFYLTGINQPDSVLILFPGNTDPAKREVLFIQRPTPTSTVWFGPSLTREVATLLSGIGEVKWLDELENFADLYIHEATGLYLEGGGLDEKFSAYGQAQSRFSLSPLLVPLRMVKEEPEVQEIRKAGEITRSAFLRALGRVKPGSWEYEVEADIIAEFLRRGAEGHAYDPIVATGQNALILHYIQNSSQCSEGELLLMDFGAEVNNYAADCSRTVPVGGRFSGRQREIYDAVLRVFRKTVRMMVPGISVNELNEDVGKLWEEEHIALGLYSLKEARGQNLDNPLWKKYFMHGITHSLGLDVHDPFDRGKPFEPGMVLTCEPAIYIREEGLGIRLENDILITENGPVDLLEEIPIEAEEIEQLMQTKR